MSTAAATIADAARQITVFASAVYDPQDVVEIRRIRGEEVRSTWHAAAELPDLADTLTGDNLNGWNIYAGANPREKRGARKDETTPLARVVFADFDDVSPDDALACWRCAGLPEPLLVIASGHGTHVYVRLSEPVTDLLAWREVQWDLALLLGADVRVKNPERIMRLPGFWNLKREPHVECRIVESDVDRRVPFAELRAMVPARPQPTPRRVNGNGHALAEGDRVKRCRAYLARCPDAIEHQHGHDNTYRAAMECLKFDLSRCEADEVMDWFNATKCHPLWSEKELAHKLDDADKNVGADRGCRLRERSDWRPKASGNGHGTNGKPKNLVDEALELGAQPAVDRPTDTGAPDELVFSPSDPLPTARVFRRTFYTHADGSTLYHDGALFQTWDGTRYVEHKDAAILAQLYPYLERARKWVTRGKSQQLVPFAPNQTSVGNARHALASLAFTPRQAPCWLSDRPNLPDPTEIIAATNGLVRLRPDATAELIGPPTPLFFSPNALDYPFDQAAPEPTGWLRFLDSLWPDDREAIECLQEFFGYCLTPDTRQQKALLLVGPKRAGKGTIARVLGRMIGQANVCGPTLSGLATNFGLWALIGKLLAIVSDARLSGRADQGIITERILALTGEDAITIDRKNLEPVTARLATRLMILTNELPRLADASGALASRFLILTLAESFYGREDTALEEKICRELPGILLWAIEGWRRLRQRGHFVQPATSAAAVEELNDLSSPVSAFVRDWCAVRPGTEIPVADLFEAWGLWCRRQGREQPGTAAVFGRDLRAAFPGIATRQRGTGDERYRAYEGVDLTEVAKMTVAAERAKTHRQTRVIFNSTCSETKKSAHVAAMQKHL